MKPIAVSGAIEFSCGAHSNNNINYSVPITCFTHMNFSPQKRLISASSDLASSTYLSLHTNNLSRVKGSIDKLVCWLAFGFTALFSLKRNTRPRTLINVTFTLWVTWKPLIQSFLPSFLHSNDLRYIFWRKALDSKFTTHLSLDCLETNKQKTTHVLCHISK